MMLRLQRGFSLIEMVIVIIILGIIVGMSSQLLMQGLYSFPTGADLIDANWQGQLAIERMSRDILQVRSASDISSMTSSNFGFTDLDANTISYSLSGTDLILTQNGSSQTLAQNIQSLTFSYFDHNGASTVSTTSVSYVKMSMTVTTSNVTYSLTTMIYPRNLA